MTDRQMVFVPAFAQGGSKSVLHTDRECSRLQTAREVHTYPRDSYPDAPICQYCRDDVTIADSGGDGPWQQLEDLDADDLVTDGGQDICQPADGMDRCNHPLSSIERRGEPDWKNGSQTIWYYGFCVDCGASVEVEYEYDGTSEVDVDV